jgi:hypothetical protein
LKSVKDKCARNGALLLTPSRYLFSLAALMAIIEDTKGRIFNEPRFPMKFKECLRRIIGGRSFGNGAGASPTVPLKILAPGLAGQSIKSPRP